MTDRIDLDQLEKLATAAYSAVPYREGTGWHWSGHGEGGSPAVRLSAWRPGYGRCTVMDFDRWGMQGAQPRFPDDILAMRDARDLLTFEVGNRVGVTAAHADPSVYRYDVAGIAHPIPTYIAAAHPAAVLALITELRALRAESHTGRVGHARFVREQAPCESCEPCCDCCTEGDLPPGTYLTGPPRRRPDPCGPRPSHLPARRK